VKDVRTSSKKTEDDGGSRYKISACSLMMMMMMVINFKQEAFEKCCAHSPLQAAARRIAIHQV